VIAGGSFADSAYCVTQMIRLCAHVGYPVDGRRHKTDWPLVASRVLSMQIADEGGPRAADSDGWRAAKAPGLKRAAVNTLGSQDRRRIGPGPVAGHVGFATRLQQSPGGRLPPGLGPGR